MVNEKSFIARAGSSRLLIAALIALLAIMSVGCAPRETTGATVSNAEMESIAIGTHIEDVHAALGEPHGQLYGFWGDIYDMKKGGSAVIYYDGEGLVERITIHTGENDPQISDTTYETFRQVILKLYRDDPGLNQDIDYIAIDTTNIPTLIMAQLIPAMQDWANEHGWTLLDDTYESLTQKGYISWDMGFEKGLLFRFENVIITDSKVIMNVTKYRAPLGAIGGKYIARLMDGEWILEEPTEFWIS
jgi:hypothetical protein